MNLKLCAGPSLLVRCSTYIRGLELTLPLSVNADKPRIYKIRNNQDVKRDPDLYSLVEMMVDGIGGSLKTNMAKNSVRLYMGWHWTPLKDFKLDTE